MPRQIQLRSPQLKYQLKQNVFALLLLGGRAFIMFCVGMPLLLLQNYLVPLIIFNYARRYVSCILNLVFCRVILLCLGFFKFQCDNFRFFDRNSVKFVLRSGHVGVAQHKNIIDFLYYSYLFTPLYARLIIINIPGIERQVQYTPLSYKEAWIAACSYRGFQPIVVSSQEQLKKIKRRKMGLNTLISQCFQEILGPILILLPGIDFEYNIAIEPIVAMDIYDIETKYLRSGVGFSIQYSPQHLFTTCYRNQGHLIMKILSSFSVNKLKITALTFRKYRPEYNKDSYAWFIDKLYTIQKQKPRNIEYEEYIKELNLREKTLQPFVIEFPSLIQQDKGNQMRKVPKLIKCRI